MTEFIAVKTPAEMMAAVQSIATAAPKADSLKVEAEKAAAFLDLLSEHLEGSEMPGKAGDCTVVARRLRNASKREGGAPELQVILQAIIDRARVGYLPTDKQFNAAVAALAKASA